MENGKTIKQIADELGVSKTAVYKKIDNLGLRSSLRKIANQFTVDNVQETQIKSMFLENQSQTKNVNQSQTSLQLISMLQKELEIKNQQIEELQRELSKEREYSREQANQMAVIADQAQRLQLAQMQPPMLENVSTCEADSEAPTKSRWKFWKK